jgi:phytoene dehydrogenase-like protein
MAEKSIIIIGAGVAGLSAGCYAQMNGYRSRIFEHHSQPGGVAAAWKRKDYLIDGGIHFVMGHRLGTGLHEVYRQVGILPANHFVDLTTYGWFLDEASGRYVEVDQNLDHLASDLKALSPADAQIVDELVAGARAMQGLDMSEIGLSKPPELTSLGDQIKETWSMRSLLKWVTGKYGKSVAEYCRMVKDPWLRTFLENLFMPDVPVYFLFMLLGMLADGQLALIQGGCREFVGGMEDRYRSLGGEITYKATVEEILVEDDRAVGVRLADSAPPPREHRAAAVVSAADGYSTIFKLLGGRYVDDKIRRRYAEWKTFRPLMMLSYGVAQEFPNKVPFGVIGLRNPINVGEREVGGIMVRIFNYSATFAPPGKTVVQVEFETDWDFWSDLQRTDRVGYDAEKERIAAAALKRLEAHFPGISGAVEVIDVATPYTTWRYTLNHKGAWEGWLLTPEAMRTSIERMLPGLDDFYMAGQWVMPGGGIPGCLYSGQHVVQLLCHRDGKRFTTISA